MYPDSKPRTPRYWLALFLVVLSVTLGTCHNRAVDRGHADTPSTFARELTAPPTGMLGRVSQWFGSQSEWIFRGRSLAGENHRLATRLAELEGENAALKEKSARYDQLRDDLGFVRQAQSTLLPADILSRRIDFKFETLLVARGESDGVKVGNTVMTRNGLVGRVTEVTGGTASVLLITDQKSGVGARVQRPESRALGVCKGTNSSVLNLTYLDNAADIRIGDEIVTSGNGKVFPGGLRIGTVLEVKPDPGSAVKVARIRPIVNFDRLEEVYIVK